MEIDIDLKALQECVSRTPDNSSVIGTHGMCASNNGTTKIWRRRHHILGVNGSLLAESSFFAHFDSWYVRDDHDGHDQPLLLFPNDDDLLQLIPHDG